MKRVVNQNKVYYENISKYGKTIGKELESKPEYEEPLFKDWKLDKSVLNRVIAEHMYRSGNYNAAEAFTAEANFSMPADFKEQFVTLN